MSTWLNAYESMGFLGLYDGDMPGRPPRLKEDQQGQIGTWLDDSPRKGTRPEIPTGDDHGRVYVFSAADPLCGKVHYRIAPSNHKEDVVAFLEQMRSRYQVDKLVFRLDNHKSHKAHIVTQFVEEDGNMQLEPLKRYTSFKCNPIERLFKWFRRVVTHNEFFKSITDLKSAIRAFFRSVANQPKRIISLLKLNLNSFP